MSLVKESSYDESRLDGEVGEFCWVVGIGLGVVWSLRLFICF